jgi:hypothetical protein
MFRGDGVLFEEAFGYGCPKFITAAPPAFDNPTAAAPQEVRPPLPLEAPPSTT